MDIQRIGILSIGEMGAACARLFREKGARVVTVISGRSERTRALARNAGVEAVEHANALLDASDLILSLVTPSSAMTVCREVAEAMKGRTGSPIFIDANPTSPMIAEKMAELITSSGGRFIDGAIIGSAAEVGRSTALYVSGPGADGLKHLEQYGLRVKVLGEKVGQASALKIFNAGLNKGMAALLTELLMGASKAGILDEVVDLYNGGFRDIVKRMDGFLTGMSQHARRRSEEMIELEDTLRHGGMEPVMTPAIRDLLSGIASVHLDPIEPAPNSYRVLLSRLAEKKFLLTRGADGRGAIS